MSGYNSTWEVGIWRMVCVRKREFLRLSCIYIRFTGIKGSEDSGLYMIVFFRAFLGTGSGERVVF